LKSNDNKKIIPLLQIIVTPFISYILLILLYQLKKIVAITFECTYLLWILTIFIYIAIGILLARLCRIHHEILSKKISRFMTTFNILFCQPINATLFCFFK